MSVQQEVANQQPQTEAPAEAPAEAAAEAPAELSLNDLMSLKLIIQVSTRRGCWLPEELEDVGKLYKRLSSFLERVAPQQEQNTDASSQDTQGTAATEVGTNVSNDKIVI
jgi:hypothetical protein